MAAISLACGYITKPAVTHLVMNSFKNLAAVSFEADYSFKQADKLKAAAKAAPASTGAPAKKEAVKEAEPEKEEEADVDMGGLFGDDDY
jgi:ribosomal protein L12E/L44/L45/RPP1/RPP2